MNRWPVRSKAHAKHRLRERFPGMKAARMVDEVRDALLAGRVAADRPAWLTPPPWGEHTYSLYAWTADKQRTYVLHTTDSAFVIVTVMEPNQQVAV